MLIAIGIVCLALVAAITGWSLGRNTSGRHPSRPGPNKSDAPQWARRGFNSDDIGWNEQFDPPLSRTIQYANRNGEYSEREVFITCRGEGPNGKPYVGAIHDGVFKTFREDRILRVDQALPASPPSSIGSPMHLRLPDWHASDAIYKVPSVVGNKRWTVNLSQYTCTCPERRVRETQYQRHTVGMVCPHMARAIRENHPNPDTWPTAIVAYVWSPTAGSMAHTL